MANYYIGGVGYVSAFTKDEKGNPTDKAMILRRSLAKKYMAHLDIDELSKLVDDVDAEAGKIAIQQQVDKAKITDEDLDKIDNQ